MGTKQPATRAILLFPFLLAAASPGNVAEAGERLSTRHVLRPVVMPAMAWLVEAGADVLAAPGGDPRVLTPNLATRWGVPALLDIPWGLELGATLSTFVVSPSPPALDWAGKGSLMLRMLPSRRSPIETESRETFELAVRVELGRDPTEPSLPFRSELAVPMILRVAGDALRLDVVPSIAHQTVVERGTFATRLVASLQVSDGFWVGLDTGMSIPDLADGATFTVPLGLQTGLTFAGAFGPFLEVMVEAAFPRFFVPGAAGDALDAETFRVAGVVRVYSYWELSATHSGEEDPARRRRCEGERGRECPSE